MLFLAIKKIRLSRILKFFIFQIFVCVPKNSQNIFAILLRRTLANFFLRKNILRRGSEKEKIPNGEYVSLFEQWDQLAEISQFQGKKKYLRV